MPADYIHPDEISAGKLEKYSVLYLPFSFMLPRQAAVQIEQFVEQVKNLARDKRDQIIERNRQIDDGVFQMVNDPRRKMTIPPKEPVPPFLNFAPLQNARAILQKSPAGARDDPGRCGS